MGFTRSSYLGLALDLDRRRETLKAACEQAQLLHSSQKFDAVVLTGMSGAAVGFAVADYLGLPVTIVRKDENSSHSGALVEGHVLARGDDPGNMRFLWVDDFVASGTTLARVRHTLKNYNENMVIVGVLLYATEYNPRTRVLDQLCSENWSVIRCGSCEVCQNLPVATLNGIYTATGELKFQLKFPKSRS